MRWQGDRESENVDDRRQFGGGGVALGGGATLLLVVLALFLGVDPRVVLQQAGGGRGAVQAPAPAGQNAGGDQANDEQKRFVSVVLADTEDVWHVLLREKNIEYREPKLVLFSGQVDSACGMASAAVGPFYCPQDEQVYLDLEFFDELQQRFAAPGDFARAYVIAHEVGHHVQKVLGISERVQAARERASKVEANHLSVRLELQADFLAGVWAFHAQKLKHLLDPGDLESALTAANAIGDDRLQREARGRVVPDSFTHGTSQQRIKWFRKGFDAGRWQDLEEIFRLPYDEL